MSAELNTLLAERAKYLDMQEAANIQLKKLQGTERDLKRKEAMFYAIRKHEINQQIKQLCKT